MEKIIKSFINELEKELQKNSIGFDYLYIKDIDIFDWISYLFCYKLSSGDIINFNLIYFGSKLNEHKFLLSLSIDEEVKAEDKMVKKMIKKHEEEIIRNYQEFLTCFKMLCSDPRFRLYRVTNEISFKNSVDRIITEYQSEKEGKVFSFLKKLLPKKTIENT